MFLKGIPDHIYMALSVYADGSICLDILQNQWSPIYDVAAILTSIQVSFLMFFLMLKAVDVVMHGKEVSPREAFLI